MMRTIWRFYRGVLVGLVLVLVGFYAISIFAPAARVGTALADLPCGHVGDPCRIGERTYHLAAPDGPGPFPIVLAFHGSGGSGANFVGTTWFANTVATRGYVLIAPDALDVTYSGGRRSPGWIFEGRRGDRDDHRFVSAVLDDVRDRFGLGSDRILLSGFSNGATFAWYLACAGADRRFRAVAPGGGSLVRGRPLACDRSGHRFHLLQTHGRADEISPFSGSGPSAGWPGWQSPEDGVAFMAEKADCRGRTTSETGPFQRTTWTGCARRLSIGIALHDGGHSLPTAWADMVLDWFEALPPTVR